MKITYEGKTLEVNQRNVDVEDVKPGDLLEKSGKLLKVRRAIVADNYVFLYFNHPQIHYQIHKSNQITVYRRRF